MMRLKLKVASGSMVGREIPLGDGNYMIGRGKECYLRARSELVSRKHAEIVVDEEAVVVRDLASRNGTYVNGTRIDGQLPLGHGDLLRIGPMQFEVVLESQTQSVRPKVRSVSPPPEPALSGVSPEDDISQWLDEEPTATTDLTRTQWSGDDETGSVTIPPQSATAAESEKDSSPAEKTADKKKVKPGKLPPVPPSTSASSGEAAANVLKSLSRRK
jgi:pSer/pThr/pTyr-binding forkhead associated (FHA) protein